MKHLQEGEVAIMRDLVYEKAGKLEGTREFAGVPREEFMQRYLEKAALGSQALCMYAYTNERLHPRIQL